MKPDDYKKLVEKEIQKDYRKVNQTETKKVDDSQKEIVKDLELENRVFETAKRQCFASLKDHKKNFPQNPQVRLINPTKTEVGKPSKQILDQIISTARSESGLNQWKSNTDVINWFKTSMIML